jgi:hypothetical protein
LRSERNDCQTNLGSSYKTRLTGSQPTARSSERSVLVRRIDRKDWDQASYEEWSIPTIPFAHSSVLQRLVVIRVRPAATLHDARCLHQAVRGNPAPGEDLSQRVPDDPNHHDEPAEKRERNGER